MLDRFPQIKQFIKNCYLTALRLEVHGKAFIWSFLFRGNFPDPKDIPIIINNFNRLEMLKQLISALEQRGHHNIIIIDNQSTYPPLLDYYKTTPYKVILLDNNYGYLALWKAPGLFKQFKNHFYVYTDPDVVPDEGCPDDFMNRFLNVMKKYPSCQKVGFGIRIDDLPDCYKEKQQVIWWEKQHWDHPIEDNLFLARIDTTFALYRPFCKGGHSSHFVLRTGFPYVIQHLPWYQDSNHLTEEDSYYISHTRQSTMWTAQAKQ